MLKKIKPKILLSTILVLALICINATYYVHSEQLVYSWDQTGYWVFFYQLANIFNQSPLTWIITVISDIKVADYNTSSIFLLLPFYYLINEPRLCYILAVAATYILSLSFILAKYITESDDFKLKGYFFFVIIIASTYIPFWRPVLRGYPDIIGLIPIMVAVMLTIKKDYTKEILFKDAVTLGIIIWLPFLFRRWYVYSIIPLYLSLPVLNYFIHSTKNKFEFNFEKIKNTLINFTISGFASIYFCLIFQYGLIIRILKTNYVHIYSAYQGTVWDSLTITVNSTGLYIFPLFFIGLIYCFKNLNTRTGKIGLFCCINLVITFILFTITQIPGIQHQLPCSLWILILSFIGIGELVSFFKKKFSRIILLSSIIIFSICIMITTLYRLPEPWKLDNPILPAKTYGLRFDNYQNYLDMSDNIEKLVIEGGSVSIFSSSEFLNDSLMLTISRGRLDHYLQLSAHADLRDKLFLGNFKTRYVLVADPIQFHLRPEGQRVISIPAEQLLTGTGIGRAYKKLPYDFELENGIHAYLYEKIRPFTQEEAQEFLNQFIEIYPHWQSYYGDGTVAKELATGIYSTEKIVR